MYEVLWFRNGNDLERRTRLYYKRPAVDLALEWKSETVDWHDSVHVYDNGNLIWVDGRAIDDVRNKSPAR